MFMGRSGYGRVGIGIRIALSASLGAGALAADATPARTAEAACLPVHGPAILAGDLAAVNPMFAALDPQTPVGAAPMAGARRVFRGLELARLVRQNHLSVGPLRDVCFEWPAVDLSPGALAAAMARALGYEADAVVTVDWSRFPVPPGELVFEKRDLEAGPGPSGRVVFWRGFVRYAAGWRFPVWAKVRIAAPVRRVAARTALPPGEPIAESQLEVVIVADGVDGGVYASSTGEVAGRVPRTRIEPGAAIRLSDLTLPPEIQAGDAVQVEVRNGPMRIRFVARAERSGWAGDTIPLTNLESAAHFRARVDGRDRAVVTIGSQ
jgi:flagella basal body P-ring formation protein FlgA